MNGLPGVLSIASAGLSTAGDQLANTSAKIANFAADPNVGDLTNNLVNLNIEKLAYKANAKVLQTTDQMLGNLLDVLDTDHPRRA